MADDRDGVRWQVETERSNEAQRVGVGIRELQKTLEHLRKRGDSRAKYMTDTTSGWVDCSLLGSLPIGGSLG